MIYTPKLISFLQRHYNIDCTGVRLAGKLKVSYTSLKCRICQLRKQGYAFADNIKPVGHVNAYPRKDGGTITRIKTVDGFKYVPTGRPPGKQKSTPKPATMPKTKIQSAKPERKVLTRHNSSKEQPYHTSKNPDVMKNLARHEDQIRAGWRTVPIGKGIWAFRPPVNL
jgi:hypothetical protein